MAIYYNGIKIAGRGIDGKNGKTAYETAKLGGYTGTEAEYNEQLVAIGEAVAGFNDLRDKVDAAEENIQAAIDNAEAKLVQVNTTVNNAITQINQARDEALSSIPNAETIATKQYVTEQINAATASIVTDIFYYGSTAPSNTKLLWIDSNSTTGGLKYHNGTSWAHVPVAWG